MRGLFCSIMLLVGAWAVSAPAQAAPAGDPGRLAVRVLLVRVPGPIWLGESRVEAGPAGLRVDGVEQGSEWWAEGEGSRRIGERDVQGRVGVYRGATGLWVVNHVPLERYVLGTLAGEIFEGWEPEMLKAQAVAVRSFALHRRREREDEAYDVVAGTRDQVYLGHWDQPGRLRDAVHATRGEVLVHSGAAILAAFHSASGGRTASAEEVWGRPVPYLVSLDVVDEEDSPDTYWRARVAGPTMVRALGALGLEVGKIREVRVAERSESGRVTRLRVEGDRGSGTVSARALRSEVGNSVLRSTLFEVFRAGDDTLFVGSGHGHGVGMSQWGGQAMASRGATYREILDVFYPGARLVRGDYP